MPPKISLQGLSYEEKEARKREANRLRAQKYRARLTPEEKERRRKIHRERLRETRKRVADLDPKKHEEWKEKQRFWAREARKRVADLDPKKHEERKEKHRLWAREARKRLPPEKREEIKKRQRIAVREAYHRRLTEEQKERHRLLQIPSKAKMSDLSEEERDHRRRQQRLLNLFKRMCGETNEEAHARRLRDGHNAFKKYKSLCLLSSVSTSGQDKPASQVNSSTDPQTRSGSGTARIDITNPSDSLSFTATTTNELNNPPKASMSSQVIEDSQKAGTTEDQLEKNSASSQPKSPTINLCEDELKEEFEDQEYFVRKDKLARWDDDDDCWLDYDSHIDGTFQKRRIDESIAEWTLRVCGDGGEDSNRQNPQFFLCNREKVPDSTTQGKKNDTLPKASVNNLKFPSDVIETEEERAQRWKDELERRIAYYCKILGEKKGEKVVEKYKKQATDSVLGQRFVYNYQTNQWEKVIEGKKPKVSRTPIPKGESSEVVKYKRARQKRQERLSKLTPEELEAEKAKLAARARVKIRMDKEEWRIFEILTSLDPLKILEDEPAIEVMDWWSKYTSFKCPVEVKEWRDELYPLLTSKPSETETEDEKFQRFEKIMETLNECVTKYGDIVKEHLLAKKEYINRYYARNTRHTTEEEKELHRVRFNAYCREKHRKRKGLPPLENCQPIVRKIGIRRKRLRDMTEEEKNEEKRKWDSYMRERYRSKKDDPSYPSITDEKTKPSQNKRRRTKKTDKKDTFASTHTFPEIAPTIDQTMGEISTSAVSTHVASETGKEAPLPSCYVSTVTNSKKTRNKKERKGRRKPSPEVIQAPVELDSNTVGDDDSMENNYNDDHDDDPDWIPIATFEIDAMIRNAAMEHPQVLGSSTGLNFSAPPPNQFPLNQFPSVVASAPRPAEDIQGHFSNELNASSSAFLTPPIYLQQQQVFGAQQQPLFPPQLNHNLHNLPNSFHFHLYNQPQQHRLFPSQPQPEIPLSQNYLAPPIATPLNYSSQPIQNHPLLQNAEDDSTRSLRNGNYTNVENVKEKEISEEVPSEQPFEPISDDVLPTEGTTEESIEDPQEQPSSANDPNEVLLEMEDKQRPMCPHCSKYFETQPACDKHVKKVHESPIPFACKLCCRGFPNSKDLIYHIWSSHYDIKQDSSTPLSNESMSFCSFCGIWIKWSDHLNLHMLLFHPKEHEAWLASDNSVEMNKTDEGNLFSCETCDSEFRTEDFLLKHKELLGHSDTKSSVLIFRCTLCHKKFSSRTLRDYHYFQDCTLRVVKCIQCEESFPSHILLQEHVLVTHSKNVSVDLDTNIVPSAPKKKKEYKCELCKRSHKKISAFLSHFSRQHWSFLSTHILETPATAISVTEEETTSTLTLTSTDQSDSISVPETCNIVSTNIVEAIEQFVCTCNVCQNYFTGKTIHEIHKAYKKICAKKCDVCDRQFVKTASLIRHKIEIHKIDKRTAKLVEAVLNSQDENAESKIAHTEDVSTRSVMCTICFVSLSPSDFHRQHETVGSYSDPAIKSCTFCEKKLVGSFNLLRHTRQFHTGSSTSDDSTSQKSQSVSSNPPLPFSLSNRIVVYPCSVCRTIFNSQKFLAVHLESKHPEVKETTEVEPHGLCELCNKTFSHVENLMKHQKEVHELNDKTMDKLTNGEFNCKICLKVFEQEDKFRVHMSNVHFPQHFNTFCQFCGKQLRPEYIRRHTKFYHPEHAASITKFESLQVPLVQLLQLLGDIQDGKEKMLDEEKEKGSAETETNLEENQPPPTEGQDCTELPLVEVAESLSEEVGDSEELNEINEMKKSLMSSPLPIVLLEKCDKLSEAMELFKSLSRSSWPIVLVKNCDKLVKKYAKVKEVNSAVISNKSTEKSSESNKLVDKYVADKEISSTLISDKSIEKSNKPENNENPKKNEGKNIPISNQSKVQRNRTWNSPLVLSFDPAEKLMVNIPTKTYSRVRKSQKRISDPQLIPQGHHEIIQNNGEPKASQENEHNDESFEQNNEEAVIPLQDSEIKDELIIEDVEVDELTESEEEIGSWCLFPIPESQDDDDDEMHIMQDPLHLPCYANNWKV